MDWLNTIPTSIQYIENHLYEDINVESIAKSLNISPFYFQKGFLMLCGYSVSEYIRNRRLTMAGADLLTTELSVTNIAMKYHYDTPDSFSRAFSRFHGASPTEVRKGEKSLKSFAPLKLRWSVEGGLLLDYKIVKKDAITLIGASKVFPYDVNGWDINNFWQSFANSDDGKYISKDYGFNWDISSHNKKLEFEYWVAEEYDPTKYYPDYFKKKTIPSLNWIVFPCVGPSPYALIDVYQRIFSEWIPEFREYELEGSCFIEKYDDPNNYPKGYGDPQYYVEIWFPLKGKPN